MKKILIGGAGHGGLTAAINLVKAGYDVTVLEERSKENLGHDWHDSLNLDVFENSGIPKPRENMYDMGQAKGFRNPSVTKCIKFPKNHSTIFMDRKVLISYLVEHGEKVGVKFLFNHKIISPIVHNATVKGLIVSCDDEKFRLIADLVIDSAGIYSPIRSNLPTVCNVERHFENEKVFHTFRAYYKNKTGETTDPSYIVSLFHLSRPGIDWTIMNKSYVDILIGKFSTAGKLTEKEVEEALNAFRKEYPYIDKIPTRGGSFADIPITRMLPMIICDGYAAVGDSAGMTSPLYGSGIVLSMVAGKLLADTFISSGGDCSKAGLWRYEYEYFSKWGKNYIVSDILKSFATNMKSEHVDFILENYFFTEDISNLTKQKDPRVAIKQLRKIFPIIIRARKVAPALLKSFKLFPLLPVIRNSIPETYNENKVNAWAKIYKAI